MISVNSLNSHVLSLIFLINDFWWKSTGIFEDSNFFFQLDTLENNFPDGELFKKSKQLFSSTITSPYLIQVCEHPLFCLIFFFFIKYRAQESTFFIFHFSNIEIDNDYLLFHIYVVPSRFSRLENSARWYFARVCMHRKKRPRASRIANSNITPSSPSLSLRPK